ncbi:MAG: hypothetical protein IPJ43_11130 [Saprospiraceae bacterium]|nr:hypothetical protein [Saprospiraceae bacterium]
MQDIHFQCSWYADSIQLSTLNHTTNFGITLSSNISDKVDYSLSSGPTLNLLSTNQENSETNNFINQSAKLKKLNWIILEGFVLRTDYTLSAFVIFKIVVTKSCILESWY